MHMTNKELKTLLAQVRGTDEIVRFSAECILRIHAVMLAEETAVLRKVLYKIRTGTALQSAIAEYDAHRKAAKK